MALIPDSLSIRPIDGTAYRGVTNDATTQIGLFVELNGEAVTVDAGCTCVVRNGSTTQSLTVSVATQGEVTASLTAADITALGATVLSGLVATFNGTVSSGTRQLKYEMPFILMDRGRSAPITLAELKRSIAAMNHAATVPSGQTNLWPQVIDILQEFWDELDSFGGDLKTYLITNPGELRRACLPFVKCGLLRYLAGNDNGQSHLSRTADRYQVQYDRVVAGLKLTIKKGSQNFGESDSRETVQAVPPMTWSGSGVYQGGPL